MRAQALTVSLTLTLTRTLTLALTLTLTLTLTRLQEYMCVPKRRTLLGQVGHKVLKVVFDEPGTLPRAGSELKGARDLAISLNSLSITHGSSGAQLSLDHRVVYPDPSSSSHL